MKRQGNRRALTEKEEVLASDFGKKLYQLPLTRHACHALMRSFNAVDWWQDRYGAFMSFEKWADVVLGMHELLGDEAYRRGNFDVVRNFGIKSYRELIDALRFRLDAPSTQAMLDARQAIYDRDYGQARARERQFHERHKAGETYSAIARDVGISAGRVRELARKWERIQAALR